MTKTSEKTFNIAFIVIIIILFFESIYVVNLHTELGKTMNELVRVKSEDHIFVDEYLSKDINIEKENNVSANSNKHQHVKLVFLKINPEIDINALKSKYKKIKKVNIRTLSTRERKRVFIASVLPAIKESRNKLLTTYKSVADLQDQNLTIQDEEYLKILYKIYKVPKGNIKKLLLSIKPHPISIVLAQATLESGWGSSRFYKEANNIFGIWSFSQDDDRIKAKSRKGVYLRKYDSFVEAVDDYMAMLGRNPRYEEFRKERFKTENPYKIIKHLEIYSELRKEYVNRLRLVIKANKFQKYDFKKENKIDE